MRSRDLWGAHAPTAAPWLCLCGLSSLNKTYLPVEMWDEIVNENINKIS